MGCGEVQACCSGLESRMGKTGILLLNTGSPVAPTSEAVASYLRSFLSDPRICPMNPHVWSFVLKRFIIPKRAPVSAGKYASIWTETGSPLDAITESLAGKLEATLSVAGMDAVVSHAMSYGSPSVGEALRGLADQGCDHIVAIPLYPQSAFSTTGAVRDKLDESLAMLERKPDLLFVENYYREDAYIDGIAETIKASGFGRGDEGKLLFAFHPIPTSDIRDGDSYPEQTAWTAQAVANKLGITKCDWRIGYQSRFDKSRSWLGPSVNAVLEEFAESGSDLFVVAPNFSIDCLETLYDIDIVLRRRFEDAGCTLHYVPCLNDLRNQIELLKELIAKSGEAI